LAGSGFDDSDFGVSGFLSTFVSAGLGVDWADAVPSVSYSIKSAPTSILPFSPTNSFLMTPEASDLIST